MNTNIQPYDTTTWPTASVKKQS